MLVGESSRITHLKQMITKVSRENWPVLLLGETGAGKEVIARAIHTQNTHQQRNNGSAAFVVIDCSALVGPLMESELFGHVKGAFTGAMGAKTGLIELANGGTAFFDEIGELPLEMQAKLLRVLQEKEFRPVGATHTRSSDFRVIAATNRDLAKEVERGNFRQDLYYRLNVLPLRIPALRDRKEDIPLLIEHFLERHFSGRANEAGYDEESRQIDPDAMLSLLDYEWPGNVRELENCIHHMIAVASGEKLQKRDLPSAVQNFAMAKQVQQHMVAAAGAGSSATSTPRMPPQSERSSGIVPLMEMERNAILNALQFTRGDRNSAANLLGIGRTTLYRKLKEYRLEAAC